MSTQTKPRLTPEQKEDLTAAYAKAMDTGKESFDVIDVIEATIAGIVAKAEARAAQAFADELAGDLPWTYRQAAGTPDHADRLARWVRVRGGLHCKRCDKPVGKGWRASDEWLDSGMCPTCLHG